MVGMGQYFIIARTLCNSWAEGGQGHWQRLVVTTNRTDVARTSLGDGNLTRETKITATSSRVSLI